MYTTTKLLWCPVCRHNGFHRSNDDATQTLCQSRVTRYGRNSRCYAADLARQAYPDDDMVRTWRLGE